MPPFYDVEEEELFEQIRAGNYLAVTQDFNDNATADLQNLMENCLCVNPEKRFDADECVGDKWVNSAHQVYRSLSRSIVSQAFNNMKSFKIVY